MRRHDGIVAQAAGAPASAALVFLGTGPARGCSRGPAIGKHPILLSQLAVNRHLVAMLSRSTSLHQSALLSPPPDSGQIGLTFRSDLNLERDRGLPCEPAADRHRSATRGAAAPDGVRTPDSCEVVPPALVRIPWNSNQVRYPCGRILGNAPGDSQSTHQRIATTAGETSGTPGARSHVAQRTQSVVERAVEGDFSVDAGQRKQPKGSRAIDDDAETHGPFGGAMCCEQQIHSS